MQDNEVVADVVQRQATVKDIIDRHMAGKSPLETAQEFNIDPNTVRDVVERANAEGRFIPPGQEGDEDFMGDKVEEPAVATPEVATTESDPSL